MDDLRVLEIELWPVHLRHGKVRDLSKEALIHQQKHLSRTRQL